jgi:valyl-tRNA synthetase
MELIDTHAEAIGLALVDIATTARRFKSEKKLPLGSPLTCITITTSPDIRYGLQECRDDIKSVTRAKEVKFEDRTAGETTQSGSLVEVEIIEE